MIPAVYTVCRFACRVIFTVVWRMRVIGAEHVPRAGPLIVVCNHISNLDPPALGAAAPRPLAYMAKRELFAIPVLGPLISWLGAFPVDRSRGDVAAIKTSLGVLRAGAACGIFPEGGRNVHGDKRPQNGAALLARLSGAPVVPVYIGGTSRAGRLARVTVIFGKPVSFEMDRKARRDDLAKLTDDLMERIDALRETLGGN